MLCALCAGGLWFKMSIGSITSGGFADYVLGKLSGDAGGSGGSRERRRLGQGLKSGSRFGGGFAEEDTCKLVQHVVVVIQGGDERNSQVFWNAMMVVLL